MSARDRREARQSTARRRAAQRGSGYATTLFNMPEGLGFWKLEKGIQLIDIIPYTVGEGNPYADPGELHFERTFYTYNKIGADEQRYVAPAKTVNRRDFIQEWVSEKSKDPKADQEMLKGLAPKERQIFLIYDRKDPQKGLQLFEFSFHKFGKLLDTRTSTCPDGSGWDLFYYPDEDGFSLSLTVTDTGTYGLEVTAIDFFPRKTPIPDEIVNHNICLDDILNILSYEELKARFLMLSTEDVGKESGSSEPRVQQRSEEPAKRLPSEPAPEPKKKEPPPKKVATAMDSGINRGDSVRYKGRDFEVIKISPDGTSLTLMDSEGEVEKAIGVDEVTPVATGNGQAPPQGALETKAEPKQEARKSDPPFEETVSKKDASSGDKDWDSEWD